jgi:hypothetical protein
MSQGYVAKKGLPGRDEDTAVSECVTLVSCYVLRRKRSGSASDEDDTETAYEYQVWIVAHVYCGPHAASIPAVVAKVAEGESAAEVLGEHLRKAVADVAADRAMAAVWRSADLTRQQALDLVADLPGMLRERAGASLGNLADAAGAPAVLATFGGELAAVFLLEPVLEPVTQALHGLEVAGIVIGLAMGQPHLSILCAKHLLDDKVGSGLATTFERAMRPAESVGEDKAADAVTGDKARAEMLGDAQNPPHDSARQILEDTRRDDSPDLLGSPADDDDAVSPHKPGGPAASTLS